MGTTPLSEQQIQEFQRDGYIIVKNMITPEQVQELRSDYEKAIRGEIQVPTFGDDHAKGKVVQLANPSRHIPHWQEHVYFQTALAIAKQLIGEETQYACYGGNALAPGRRILARIKRFRPCHHLLAGSIARLEGKWRHAIHTGQSSR